MGKHRTTEQKQGGISRSPEKAKVDHEGIARVAYELYEKRGHVDGCDHEDWFKAEAIVKQQGKL